MTVSSDVNSQRVALPSIPHHIGIIMDGNGRWAQGRGLPLSLIHI